MYDICLLPQVAIVAQDIGLHALNIIMLMTLNVKKYLMSCMIK